MEIIIILITSLSLIIWLFLLLFWGKFWQGNQRLETAGEKLATWPEIGIVIPARNEAELLPKTLRSLLNQDYPGKFSLLLVNDSSTDKTAEVAKNLGVKVMEAKPLPPGWTGKLWAINQGIENTGKPDYFLLTDADIEHEKNNLRELVIKAEKEKKELVSLMVLLRCESFWERLLIPAFVFFFQKLYPFPWVNNPKKKIAAAAGGCILIQGEALTRIGGIKAVSQALIDDCALAKAVKSNNNNIWLGLTEKTRSLRAYPDLKTIWDMVARTAYTQLNYSPLLLLGTILGMTLVYLVPPLSLLLGIILGNKIVAITGLAAWSLMAVAYLPTLKLYQISPIWAFSLPIVSLLYTLMTIDSALKHGQGKGGNWKGRVYPS
ncbi:MAG: glycosyltransferase [Gomphosphaeria aponina SAG 52.96 = DSM 107014]|uniref:Glycosyltransferase n=1 Tax=Gomphosphaeria aponina SAG 52.96 = DSM 107014 TaxID=1521640 RepID=A0A941GWS7_9CHRO|nr:glycosyltransferase [Gomphosphaeria aponina SAG 52.96 = DSM 107014]